MNRATWLQDRRMQKFRDVLSRFERRELSALEAGEILGCSEHQFRRYRGRYEEEGLAGLIDKRLGKASARRVPVDQIAWMLEEYRTHHMGWNRSTSTSTFRSGTASAGAIRGRRRSCMRRVWWSAPSGAGRTGASGRGSPARA